MVGFCLGMGAENAPEPEQYRNRLAVRVQEILKQILDARSVLSEDPPTTVQSTGGTGPTSSPLVSLSRERMKTGLYNSFTVRNFLYAFSESRKKVRSRRAYFFKNGGEIGKNKRNSLPEISCLTGRA